MDIKATSQQMLDKMYQMMQKIGRKCREYTHEETEHKHKLLMRHMSLPPAVETVNQIRFTFLVRHCLMIVTVPFSVNLIMLDDFALPFSSCL